MEVLVGILALALGVALGWIIARTGAEREKARLASQLADAREIAARLQASVEAKDLAIDATASFWTEAQRRSEDAFARLSHDALARNSERFLQLTSQRLAPLKESLAKLEQKTGEIEARRAQAYGSLEQHLMSLESATARLTSSNDHIVGALRGSSQARGRWGEFQLKNLIEAAGMTAHVDFLEQASNEAGTRPDLVIKLPDGDGIPVDAKVPLSAYWAAAEEHDPAAKKAHRRRHADDLRRHVRELARRDYARFVAGRIDYTVLFLSGDPILAAAFEEAPELFDDAVRQRVLIATPVTLIALLRTAQVLWNHKSMAENAREIQQHATELYRRVAVFQGHLTQVGESLGRASKSYNQAVASFQTRVLPAGRRIEELGGAAEARERLTEPATIDHELRELPS